MILSAQDDKKGDAKASPFCVSINPCRACSLSFSQGELEGAKPTSNRIKCRAKPCSARRAWSEASIFVPQSGTKITALLQAVEKSQRLFRQPEEGGVCAALLFCPKTAAPARKPLLFPAFADPYHRLFLFGKNAKFRAEIYSYRTKKLLSFLSQCHLTNPLKKV